MTWNQLAPDVRTIVQKARRAVIALVVSIALFCLSSGGAAPIPQLAGYTASSALAAPGDWPTYHLDNLRTGYLPNMPDPQQLSVAWSVRLNGAVYAEPLVVSGHVLVVTEGNRMYSLNPATGQIEWNTYIGPPVPRSALPCGNINPLGMTGTPVYDPASGLVFAVAELNPPRHVLVGVDAATGQVRIRRRVDPAGMNAIAQQQRPGLTLANGYVYIAFGGLAGDCGNYHGWVVGSRTDGTGTLLAYHVPTMREGGIWAPPGPTVDALGYLLVSVGNGSSLGGRWDKSDSVLKLSPTLKLVSGFAPNRWPLDNRTDADLGSLGPVLLPGNFVFIAGKAGIAYLLDETKLGGIGHQLQALPLCHAYGGAAVVGSTIYVPCNEGVQQVFVTNNQMTPGWRATNVSGSPVVGGQTVYSLDRSGMLHALDIANGQDRATVTVSPTTRFATPALYGNQVFVGTTTGIVAVTLIP